MLSKVFRLVPTRSTSFGRVESLGLNGRNGSPVSRIAGIAEFGHTTLETNGNDGVWIGNFELNDHGGNLHSLSFDYQERRCG